MNTQNIQFKNLKEVIIAFQNINKKYEKIELTIRSFVTPDLLKLVAKNNNIKIIDKFLTNKDLEDLYKNSDIFILPSHETCGISLLDAMSYGLAVIAMNIYDIPEVIEDMKNGILIEPYKEMNYYTSSKNPFDFSRDFMDKIKKSSKYIINQLEKKYVLLIENESLRKNLSLNAKNQFLTGKFSIQERNKELQKMFAEIV